MNKKLFTFAVGALALLTCSLTANAQDDSTKGQATYGTDGTVPFYKDVYSDLTVNSINPDKWYQIELKTENSDPVGYLSVQRDKGTGELYLFTETTATTDKVNMNESLWKVSFKKVGPAGYVYTLVNKATGFELAFNDADLKADDDYSLPLRSDVTEWQ